MSEVDASSRDSSGADRPAAIILAAGLGKRMGSSLPKVLHEVGGRPMVSIVVDVCREAGAGRVIVVVGQGGQGGGRLVRLALAGAGVEFAEQPEQLGTGHAVQCAEGALRAGAAADGGALPRDVFVLCGDGPLVRAQTLREIARRHAETGADVTLATAVVEDPAGYGRIVRDEAGRFEAIIEHKALAPEQRAIREINPSYYLFRTEALLRALSRVQRSAAAGEYYLTDVPRLLLADGGRVEVVEAAGAEDALSINTPEDLARVDEIYRGRAAAKGGVA
jgi:bifunctional UDP-N-acetylglucosamine pyrophosphorylase/glucosamine-1-phosphate N-acetyltransferase